LTAIPSSPDSSFTFALPQVVGFPLASKRQPNSPAFFPARCPAFTDTMNHPEPFHQSHDEQNIEGNRTFDTTMTATRAIWLALTASSTRR
jgi:hypothetical protein